MEHIGKILIFTGLVLIVAGIIIFFAGDKLSWLGNLPGDINIKKENFRTFHSIDYNDSFKCSNLTPSFHYQEIFLKNTDLKVRFPFSFLKTTFLFSQISVHALKILAGLLSDRHMGAGL